MLETKRATWQYCKVGLGRLIDSTGWMGVDLVSERLSYMMLASRNACAAAGHDACRPRALGNLSVADAPESDDCRLGLETHVSYNQACWSLEVAGYWEGFRNRRSNSPQDFLKARSPRPMDAKSARSAYPQTPYDQQARRWHRSGE